MKFSYRFESGGHPDHVEELTYEHFISEHKKYYHPGNSVIFLDGNIDHDAALKILDEEFKAIAESIEAAFKEL